MSGLEIQSTGEIIASCNGNIVEDAKWNMNYDGNNMIIESMYNNDLSLIQLNNQDLQRLFSNIGSHKNELEERLQRDLGKQKYRSGPKTKRVRFLDNSLRKSGKHKTPLIVNTLSDRISMSKHSSKSKRSSPKHSSPKRSSPKHSSKSKRSSSPKRSSPKRSSPKRSSPKHSSGKRSSGKRSSRKKKTVSSSLKRTKRKSIENTIY